MSNDYLFKAEKLCKSFGLTNALANVNIGIGRGRIHGLIGENGSGKSTLASICAGIQKPDGGTMYLDGAEYRPNGTIDAINHGVSMVVQEQGTISGITVAANIFMGEENLFAKSGILNVRKMHREARGILDSIGLSHIASGKMIDSLTFEDRKLVELARTLYMSPKLWIIDETTTALTVIGREILYSLMNKLRDQDCSVLFISHDIEEIIRLCDSLTILRDGVLVAELRKEEFDSDNIKQLMIGREMSSHYYREDPRGQYENTVVLKAEGISNCILKDVSIELHQGEILGIGGLSDCGMHDLGKIMFGLIAPDAGKVRMSDGAEITDAVSAVEKGIAYVSKNRDKESMMPVCSIKDNICLPSLKNLKRLGLISRKNENRLAEKWVNKLKIKTHSVDQFCNTLSGGNKQKVVLAKWLGKGSNILILDCPTRGIDIGSKASIYMLIEDLKKEGKSIILISEELPELIGMSDRITVLKDGIISGEFNRAEGLTEAKLIRKMI